jgi:hypothetical protein
MSSTHLSKAVFLARWLLKLFIVSPDPCPVPRGT